MIKAILVILTGLFAWGMERFVAWLNTKIKASKTAVKLNEAKEIVLNAVKKIYQSYVQGNKQGSKLTEEQKAEAKQMATAECKLLMNSALQRYITKELGNLDAWISTQIEATIYTLKNKKERAI